jgi:hypothetical protein
MLKIKKLTIYDNSCSPSPNHSNKTTAGGRRDRKAVTMLYNALSDLNIKTQQYLDLIDADLLLAKERNPASPIL